MHPRLIPTRPYGFCSVCGDGNSLIPVIDPDQSENPKEHRTTTCAACYSTYRQILDELKAIDELIATGKLNLS